MSSDYRPRGGSSSGGSSAGGRRRRGGRGRSSHGGHSHSENRVRSNGSSSSPKKEESFLAKLLGWFSGKKSSKPESKSYRSSTSPSSSRPDFKDRGPRTERPPREDRPKQEREIVPQEIVSPKLYVGNLAYEAAESDLFDLFSKVGAVKNVEVAMDRHSSRSKGFGFVEMESLETAKEAAAKLNRTDFMGRQIVVSGAKVDKRPTQNPREADPTSHEHESGSNPESTI